MGDKTNKPMPGIRIQPVFWRHVLFFDPYRNVNGAVCCFSECFLGLPPSRTKKELLYLTLLLSLWVELLSSPLHWARTPFPLQALENSSDRASGASEQWGMGVFSQYLEYIKLMDGIFSTLNFFLLSFWQQLLHLSKLESSSRRCLILQKFYVALF